MNPISLFTRFVYSPSRGQCLNERASICQHSSNHRDVRDAKNLEESVHAVLNPYYSIQTRYKDIEHWIPMYNIRYNQIMYTTNGAEVCLRWRKELMKVSRFLKAQEKLKTLLGCFALNVSFVECQL